MVSYGSYLNVQWPDMLAQLKDWDSYRRKYLSPYCLKGSAQITETSLKLNSSLNPNAF